MPVSAAKPVSHLEKVRALVGREREWQQLVSAWQAAVEAGPVVAIISGEPGIGKSRLADELYQSCIRQGHTAARTRCYAGQGQVAYAPVAEWLRSDAVRAGWTNLAPQQIAELARLVPEIAEQFSGAGPSRHCNPGRWLRAGSACIFTNRSTRLSERCESPPCCISTTCNGAIPIRLSGSTLC